MTTDTINPGQAPELSATSIYGTLRYTLSNDFDHNSATTHPLTFPLPQIGPRPRRPHSIHILSYPAGYTPSDLRSRTETRASQSSQRRRERRERENSNPNNNPTSKNLSVTAKTIISAFDRFFCHLAWHSRDQLSPAKVSGFHPQLTCTPCQTLEDSIPRAPTMVDSWRPSLANNAVHMSNANRNSFMSVRSAKQIMSSAVTELPNKPVASGSGLSCSIILAESHIFLTGLDHDGQTRQESHNSSALLRGKLQLNVTKNAKIKRVTMTLSGKARTDWPEGIPPLKVDVCEETQLRSQTLIFFQCMQQDFESPYGKQCIYSLKNNDSSTSLAKTSWSPADSSISLTPATRSRGSSTLSSKDLRHLSLQSNYSRSFEKGDSPAAAQAQAQKGYKVFYPGTYEYSFELPIDHHQLETTKLQYGSVKWELEANVERAGAFKPNLQGTKAVSIVRVPDQLSLEMTEPISISRQWEDQLHYDIMISGKSFPVGSKIPIAFKLTPLAKVQVHKLKVFVTESIEYWTNDRRVTRKDPGRKILLLEKVAGKPLDKQYERSEVRMLSGGELSNEERDEARAAASRRRTMEAERTHTTAQPLPEPSDNLLGDLDLGLETYWGSTEIEMNVQLPTCEQMSKDKTIRLHPDCSWKNVNVFHWIKIVMRISRLDPEDPTGKRRRHFEISIDSPFTVLNCRATQANTALPQYSSPDLPQGYRQHTSCGCPDAEVLATNPSPASSTGTLPAVESDILDANLPAPPQAAHLHPDHAAITNVIRPGSRSSPPTSANSMQRLRNQESSTPRPIHLIRVPSYNPPAFDADEPPPQPADIMTPPPNYDLIVGTPSVDGLADYFARLADYDEPNVDGDDDTDSGEEHIPTRIVSRNGQVHVPNPRTPGGRSIPSRSLEIQRPFMNLSLTRVPRQPE